MTNEKPRVQKVLAYLYDTEEVVRPKDIAEAIGESPQNVGKDLHSLKQRGLADSEGEGQWKITPEGRERIEGGEPKETGKKEREKEEGKETTGTIPSQSDLFRSIGEKLGVGSRKGDIRLDAIAYYVQRTADLDNLTSVWNALIEMGIASDVRKRWIKLYSQNLPGREIPEELREKLEGGEPERIKAEAGEIAAKPKRFSVVGGEIIGDPEGEFNFREALQYIAQQKGASPNEASSMALEVSRMGPEMFTALLSAVTPLISKEAPRSDMDTVLKLTEAGLLKKSGNEDASAQTVRVLELQIKELKDAMQKQDMDNLKNVVVSLNNQMGELRKEIQTQSHLEGRYALMDKTITTIDSQITGMRSDARPLFDTLARSAGGKSEPTRRSPEEKAKIAKGLKVAVAQERRARQLEDKLLFGKPLPEESAEVTAEPTPAPPPTTYTE